MNLTIQVDVAGLTRKMDLLIESAKDLAGPLKQLSAMKRAKIQDVFDQEGPGWAPLAASTVAHREHKAQASLERKLQRDVKRAEKSHAKQQIKFNRDQVIKQLGGALAKVSKAPNQNAIIRRLTVLSEFRRLGAGGDTSKTLLTEKQSASLRGRIQRASERASKRILGRIAQSIKAKIEKGTLTISSEVKSKSGANIAAIQNAGGTGGHGAHIPPRPFLFWDDSDFEFLRIALKQWLVRAW